MGKKHPHLASNLGNFFLTTGNSSLSFLYSGAQGLKAGTDRRQHSTALEALLGCVLGGLLCFQVVRIGGALF